VSVEAAEARAEQDLEAERGHSCPSDWPAPMRGLTMLSRVLSILEGAGIIFCLVAVVFLATWQFTARNLIQRHHFFWPAPAWADGVIRHSVFLLGFFGGAYATFTARHIRIDAVTRVLGVKARLALRVLTTIAALGIVTLFTWTAFASYRLVLAEAGEASQAEELFTSSRGAMIIVIGYAVVAFHFLVQIALDVGWLVSKKPLPENYIAEASGH